MKSVVVILSAIISFLTILIRPNNPGYEFIIFFPLVYMLCYLLFVSPVMLKKKSIVSYIFAFYGFLRYIITPFLIAIAGNGQAAYFLTNNTTAIQKASFLMIYELIAMSIFLYLFSASKRSYILRNNMNSKVILKGRKFIYFFIGLLSLLLIVLTPSIRDNLSFLIIGTNTGSRVNEDISSSLMLIRQIILTAIVMGYVTIVSILHERYMKNGRQKYFYWAIMIALINVSVIVGERRIMQVYTAFASTYVLITLFPEYRKKAIKLIMTATIVVVGLMSIYKFFDAFLYNSYIEALKYSSFDISNFTRLMQAYFFGPQNVAKSVEIASTGLQPITRLFYDVARSTMGINFLVKDIMFTTSDVFNSFIYDRYVPSGHPVSGIGYGHMYFGYLISPLLSVVMLSVAISIEKLLVRTTSLEMKYIWAYILIRLSTPFSAIPSKINVGSLILLSWGVVYLLANLIRIITSRKNISPFQENLNKTYKTMEEG